MIGNLWDCEPEERPELIHIIRALINYDQPLFPETDMDEHLYTLVNQMLRLGKIYNIEIVEKNPDLAKHFIQMAVDHGSKEAVELLKLMDD